MKDNPAAESAQFLSGWKDIAHYLGKGVRTVQRYERDLGLPIRRPAGKDRGSVVAVKAELDGWVKASPVRQAFQLKSAQPANRQATQAFQKSVTELTNLRSQMSTLRAEVKESVRRLRDSLDQIHGELMQGEVNQRHRQHPSQMYSEAERDLLDRMAAIRNGMSYPKAN